MSKKIQVSFSDRQMDLLESLKGEFGETDADVVRGIVVSWLAEKNLISTVVKQRMFSEKDEALSDDEKQEIENRNKSHPRTRRKQRQTRASQQSPK